VVDTVGAGQVTASATDTSLAAFWSEFRTAVLAADTAGILRLVERPLETRGPRDDMPWVTRDSAATVALLDSLLSNDPGLQATASSMLELVRATPEIPASMQTDPLEVRVGDFVFRKRDGRWRLYRAYLSD
jgi:hypothetical protein